MDASPAITLGLMFCNIVSLAFAIAVKFTEMQTRISELESREKQ